MGDLVNLRQARKRKQRDEKAKQAEQNRSQHGRTRHERTLADAERSQADKLLDGHQRSEGREKTDPLAKDEADASKVILSDDELHETQLDKAVKEGGKKADPDHRKVVSIFPAKHPRHD